MQLVKAIIKDVEKNVIIMTESKRGIQCIDEKGAVFNVGMDEFKFIGSIKELNPGEVMTVVSLAKIATSLRVMTGVYSNMVKNIIEKDKNSKLMLSLKDIEELLTGKGYKNLFYLQKEGTIILKNEAVTDIVHIKNFEKNTYMTFSVEENIKLAEALNFDYENLNNKTFNKKLRELFIVEKNDASHCSVSDKEENPIENFLSHGVMSMDDLASIFEKTVLSKINKK